MNWNTIRWNTKCNLTEKSYSTFTFTDSKTEVLSHHKAVIALHVYMLQCDYGRHLFKIRLDGIWYEQDSEKATIADFNKASATAFHLWEADKWLEGRKREQFIQRAFNFQWTSVDLDWRPRQRNQKIKSK